MATSFPSLFAPLTLRGVTLSSRAIMAPMSTELGGLDGAVTPELIAFYRERALGGVALIIAEYTSIDRASGRANEYQLSLDNRNNLDGHRRLVRAVHETGTKIFLQIQHSGFYASRALVPDGMPVGPSDQFSRKDPARRTGRRLEYDEILELVASFARTCALAVEAGYDGVELHGAHGYLLSQFLSPYFNKRTDEWGGDFERRMAFPLAVIRAVRGQLGDRPLSYRLSVDEFITGGLTIEDMERVAPRLVEAGVDVLHCSAGLGVGSAFEAVVEPMSTAEGWRIPYAARIRQATGVPVIAVGQIRWPEMADTAIATEQADLIALGRPMLADPLWPAKARAGRPDLIRPCTSCNWCLAPQAGRHYVKCAENPRTGSELDRPLSRDTGLGRRAVVVGAGPGGMAAALLLDQSGFETHLFEARPATGGGIVASASPPGKGKLFWYSTYLANRLEDSGVALHLGARIQPDDVVALSPDIAIVATGTSRIDLPIAGIDHPMVMDAYDLLMGDKAIGLPQGSHVLVYGGGETGCESAEFCAEMGFKVTLVSRSSADKLARSADAVYRGPLLRRLHSNPQVTIVDSCHVVGISDSGVLLEISGGDGPHTCTVDVDKVLLAQGRQPASAFAGKLEQAGIAISVVGDSKQMGRIGDAVHMAYKAVMALSAQHSAMAEPLGC